MWKILLFCFMSVTIFITGCLGQETSSQIIEKSTPTTPARLTIDGIEYISIGEFSEGLFTISQEIGEVKRKVDFDMIPYNDFESNYLEEGTKIYSVIESNSIVLAQVEEELFEIFSR
nr:hypothetical protein [Lysinibacillus timonensis]